MSWRVVVRPEVEEEITVAAEWYEAARPGLGADFASEVIHVFDELEEIPSSMRAAILIRISVGALPNDSRTALSTKSSKRP